MRRNSDVFFFLLQFSVAFSTSNSHKLREKLTGNTQMYSMQSHAVIIASAPKCSWRPFEVRQKSIGYSLWNYREHFKSSRDAPKYKWMLCTVPIMSPNVFMWRGKSTRKSFQELRNKEASSFYHSSCLLLYQALCPIS
jgi:hypothetical protein